MLEVRQTEWKGRGVFTTEDIAEDDHVESSPILLLEPTATEEQVAEIGIGDYPYAYGDDGMCIALGFGSLFNHSKDPNLTWSVDEETIEFHAVRDIAAGEELTIDYGTDIWFDIQE